VDDIFLWNDEKNAWLRANCGLFFDLVTEAIAFGELIDDIPHPNPMRSHQRIVIIKVGERHVAVPYVKDGHTRFLKTMYYSRDLDERYGDQDGKIGN
jgi:hypothetical protein